MARPDSSQFLTLETGVKYILDGPEVVSNMLNRHTYQLITFGDTVIIQGVMIGFTIDQLVAEAQKVSQQIDTANKALYEAFEGVVIDMHHFSI